jgi:hypothetical protein
MHGPPESVIRAENRARVLPIKNLNLSTALITGLLLAAVSASYIKPATIDIFWGLLAGLVYANGFEYFTHRYVLHKGEGLFCRQHRKHHDTLRSPEAAHYVLFSRNLWGVVALFCINAVPFFAGEWIFHRGWSTGAFVSFALYYMAFEELHWRSHVGGRLPGWLQPAARHHLRHHADDSGRFNVFLPMFDGLASLIPSGRTRGEIGKSGQGIQAPELHEVRKTTLST